MAAQYGRDGRDSERNSASKFHTSHPCQSAPKLDRTNLPNLDVAGCRMCRDLKFFSHSSVLFLSASTRTISSQLNNGMECDLKKASSLLYWLQFQECCCKNLAIRNKTSTSWTAIFKRSHVTPGQQPLTIANQNKPSCNNGGRIGITRCTTNFGFIAMWIQQFCFKVSGRSKVLETPDV